MALFAHLGSMGDLQGSFEDGTKFNRQPGVSLVNPRDEMKLPWYTKTHITLLLEQIEAKVSTFWNASTTGNPKNVYLAKNTKITPFERPGN